MQFEEFRQFLDRSSGTVEADEPIPPAFAGARHFRWWLFRLSPKLAEMKRQNHSCQRLIVGPWAHTSMRSALSWVGDVDFGREAVWGNNIYFAEQLRWFDRWLKDAPTGVESDPPVPIFVMGGGTGDRTKEGKTYHGGRWRAEQEWPLARTQYQNLYLGANAELSDSPPESDNSVSFLFGPAHPVPTIGGALAALMELVPLEGLLDPFWGKFMSIWHRMRSIVLEGSTHQKEEPGIVGARAPYLPLAMRSDVLVFQTPPLRASVEVTGTLTVKLWISSSAPDTDFTAKLIDVYPPKSDFIVDYCEQHNIAFLPWAPLGQAQEAHDAVKKVAEDLEASPLQVALAWLLKRSKVILPIPGTSSIKHLEENIAAASLELPQAAYDELSEVSLPAASLRG
jgi:hypothetical protein